MHHKTTIEFMVRGDTGVSGKVISNRLGELGDGESVAWKRCPALGGGEIIVTRRGERFDVTGETRV